MDQVADRVVEALLALTSAHSAAEELASTAEVLTGLAAEVQGLVRHFTLEGDAPAPAAPVAPARSRYAATATATAGNGHHR